MSKVGSKLFLFELTFDSSQKYMQRRHIFDVFLMRIKCVVKNVIIFDLIFDANQKESKSNFSCSVKCQVDQQGPIFKHYPQICWVSSFMVYAF